MCVLVILRAIILYGCIQQESKIWSVVTVVLSAGILIWNHNWNESVGL